jgi:hypothetical protein
MGTRLWPHVFRFGAKADKTGEGVAGVWRLSDFWDGFVDGLRRGEVVVIDDVARDPRTAAYRSSKSFAAAGVRA